MIVTAPAAFRFTYEAMPERHEQVASLLAGEALSGPDALPDVLLALMRDIGAPPGSARSATPRTTCPRSSRARCKQQRLLVGAPRDVTERDLAQILTASL